MDKLIINEIFYSIQGESLNTGHPTVFVRLTGCPLRCVYCDTEYAFHDGKPMDFNTIIEKINSFNCKKVMITGGEPLAQKNIMTHIFFNWNIQKIKTHVKNCLIML